MNSVRGGAEGIMFCGVVLPASVVVHCCIKYSLQISAFAVRSNINISFYKGGEIIGILALIGKVLVSDS